MRLKEKCDRELGQRITVNEVQEKLWTLEASVQTSQKELADLVVRKQNEYEKQLEDLRSRPLLTGSPSPPRKIEKRSK